MTPEQYLNATFNESLEIKGQFFKDCAGDLIRAASLVGDALNSGGKVLILGNGGSAADAQHMAAEMIGRMLVERRPLAAMALTTDTSILTAIGNDYHFDEIFSKQVEGLARPNDLLIAISTSGNSANVLKAVEAGRKIGCRAIGITGKDGGKLKDLTDVCLVARLGKNASRIQETHIFAVHSIVDLADRFFVKNI